MHICKVKIYISIGTCNPKRIFHDFPKSTETFPKSPVFVTTSSACHNVPGMCLIKMLGAAAAQIAGKVNILMTVAVFLGEMVYMYVYIYI